MKSNLTFSRWLFLLAMGLFLFGSSGSLLAQEKLSQEAIEEALHGPTVEVPNSDGRAVGDNCTTPIVVNIPFDLPYADLGNTTCGRGNTYSNSDLGYYDGGEDIIYELNVTATTEVTITLDPKTTTYSGLGLFTSCPTGLLGAGNFWIATGSGATPRIIQRILTPGTYYLMADTWPTPNCIPILDLTIAVVPPPATVTVFPFIESFETTSTTLVDWRQIQVVGSASWTYAAGAGGGAITTAYDGARNARYISSSAVATTKLVTPPLDLSGIAAPHVSFYLGQETWSPDQNTTAVYYRVSSSDPWVLLQNYTDNISTWTMFDLVLPNPSATYQIAFEGVNDYGRANVIDLVTVYDAGLTPGLVFNTPSLDLGDRPIGAWSKPATFEIVNNPGAGDVIINEADIDQTFGGFLAVQKPALPYTLAVGETTLDFGVKTTEAAVADGPFSGNFAMFFGGARAVVTAPYSGNAYTPVAGDVWELALDPNSLVFPVTVNQGSFRDNYDLPGATADGWDVVYELDNTGMGDVILDITVAGTDAKVALYPAGFGGMGGPDMDNALVSGTTSAMGVELFEGQYYLVISSTGASFDLTIADAVMPSPDAVTNLTPADGAINIQNGSMLTWAWGGNTLEYQVILGTTYPPATIVQDWTAANTAANGSYTLAGLSPNLQYFWQIITRNNNGSTNGDIWGFTTTITAPTALTVTVTDPAPTAPTVSANLSWTNPNRAFLGYNVYRNTVKINTSLLTGTTFTDLGLARNTAYSYYVTTVFDEGESAPSNTVNITTKGVGTANGFVYDFLTNDPIEGAAVRVNGPAGDYNVQTSATGAYTTLAYAGTYDIIASAAGYTSQSLIGEVITHGATTSNDFYMMESPLPVGDVVAFELSDDAVQISWDGSGPEVIAEWLAQDNGVNDDGIGAGGTPFSVSTRYTPAMLTNVAGTYLTKIKFFPSTWGTSPVFELNVWTGDAPTLVYSQAVPSVVIGQWNEFELTTPVEVTGNEDLYIGYTLISYTGWPAGCDAGPANPGFSDLLSWDGVVWESAFNSYALDINWNLQGFVTNAQTNAMVALPNVSNAAANNFRPAQAVTPTLSGHTNTSANAYMPKTVKSGDRGIVDYTVWREKVYQPGVFEVIGNTTQMNFVDFDWGIQDWGVYRWAVTVNYEAGQTSGATYSNKLDKDMETMVTVNVSLNSGEGPGGTSVTFTNISEPDLELAYNTVLDNAGTFMWDAFRKGTYDIEVMLPGYAPITETGVDIFDESEFTWLLEEILAAPTDLYVTPTAYATWSAGSGGAPFVPFMQSFDGLANGVLPDGWTKSPETTNWGAYNSANAGGVAPEMRFNWSPSGTNAFYLMSPIMSTEGQTTLNFSFKQYINDYNGVYTLRVVTIADGVEHIVQEWLTPTDLPATDMSYTLTAAHGVGATDFQVAWVFDGYSFNINYWYIDDVMLNGSRAKAGRSFETYKVFLDGQLITETTDTEYQFGSNGETLVPYQTYTAGVAAVYSTGQSATSEFDFIYVPCDDYAAPSAFTAAQVEGTLDIQLDWTNVDAAALDTISAFRIYRNGEMYDEIDFTAGAVATYTDSDLDFGMYTYCVTYIYDSGAETCQGVVCSDEVEIDGNAMVDGMVMQAAYLGGDPIEGASVMLTNVDNTALTFEFFTDATGAYEGSVVAGTYDYVVSAEGYVSEMMDGVVIALNATVTENFELMEFPYPPVNVQATELTDNTVLVTWNNPMYAPFEPVFTDFNGGIPSDWTVVNGGSTADTWQGVPNYSGNTLDGTPFAFVNSDAAGIGSTMDEMMYSSVVNALNAESLYLSFDQYFNYLGTAGEMASVDVYDGTDWVNVLTQTTDVGTFAAPNHQMIDVTAYKNEMFQVRFHYVAPGWDWYWAVDNVMITDMATRTGVPFISQSQTPDRALAGYEVYRTTCATGDLQFLGYTLDTLFNDNTWGSAASGVYKWGVVAVYEENESEVVFSNCLDKDMVTQVSVTVSTNSLDSPEGTDVMFMNTSEPDLGLVYETTLDASGYFMWDEFRKGTYDIYVNLNGFEPVEIMGYVIDGPEDFVWVLAEQLLPVSDLYVTPTGFATWRAGGVIPFEMYMETFDAGLPADWTVVDGGSNTATWTPTAAYNGNSVDGTPFMFANSDAAGSGSTMDELLISPVVDASTADVLYLKFDYVYQNFATTEYFAADVFDGSDWVNVFSTSTDTGPFPWGPTASEMIDITEYANDMLQVRFHYFSPGWNWYVAVDNVAITDQEDTRALVNYKVWLDGIFVTDTPDTFWQYDVTNLVEGQEYFSEVAAVYTNGISVKMNYTWTYHSCEGYPGPENLTGEVNGMDVTLTWGATAPPPPGGGIESDFESGSMPDGWSTVQTNTVSSGPTPAYWTVNDYVSTDFSPFGTYHAGLWWDYGHQDEWLITPEFACPAGAELNFWSVVYLGSTYLDHYYVKVSTDGGSNWTVLWDASTLSGGWNYYDSPFNVDLSAYAGDNIKLAFQAIDGDGQGLWYIFFVDNVSVSSPTRSIAFDASSLIRSSNSVSTHAGLAARDGNILAKEIINVTEDAQASGAVVNHAGASKSIAANRALLYDNGPLVNSEGTGTGGADESILQNSTLGMTTLGAGIQFALGNHMADDFVVDATWNVDEFTFYGYQTNSGNTSTMTGGYLQIYDGNPSAGGTLIWGDMTTNRMTSTQFSNIYRISETTGGTARPVMEIVCETPGLTLEPGTYWVEYTFDGSGSSGPWAPPITITGQTTTGNAQQFLGDGTGWQPFNDGGIGTPQGLPFLINGTVDNGGGGGGSFEPGPIAGVNVYRDGVLIAEMVQDTFYVDQDVDYGTYEYCVTYVYESGAESCSDACIEVTNPFPCDAPKELAGEYLWTEEAWGSMIEWNSPQDPVAEWLFYDDGTNVDGIGGPAAFTWAIKFDPAQLADFDGASLTKIQIYNRLAGADELRIYEGTNAATLLHTQTLSGLAVEAWAEVDLTSPVLLDVTQQLWIAVYTTQGALYPAGCGPTQNQPNGDLITLDGVLWEHLSDYALPYTWNLRGYVTNMDGVTAMLPMDKPADNYSNNGEALAIKGKGSEQTAGPVTTVADRMLDVFNVYRKTGTGSYSLIAAVPFVEGQSAYSYFDTDVAAQTLYTYQVTAYYTYANGTCESDPAMALLNPDEDFVTVFVTGANEMSLGATRVYPNPATNNVVIESAKMNRITVMSPIGQVVYDKATNGERSLTLNTSTYEAGIYMIRIETAEGTVTKRLTVVR